ncbi:MAG: MoaD/ThiS family protein [Bacteroidota bacterium]
MKITIHLHGIGAEIANSSILTVSGINNPEQLRTYLGGTYPLFNKYLFQIARNRELIKEKTSFENGDDIDIIFPFPFG